MSDQAVTINLNFFQLKNALSNKKTETVFEVIEGKNGSFAPEMIFNRGFNNIQDSLYVL